MAFTNKSPNGREFKFRFSFGSGSSYVSQRFFLVWFLPYCYEPKGKRFGESFYVARLTETRINRRLVTTKTRYTLLAVEEICGHRHLTKDGLLIRDEFSLKVPIENWQITKRNFESYAYVTAPPVALSGPALQLRFTGTLLDGTAEHPEAEEAEPVVRRKPAAVR